MNFNVYLDDKLGKEFTYYCKSAHKKKNAVIREALEAYIHQHTDATWSPSVLEYKGVSDMEPFESTRSELKPDNRPDFLGEDK